MSPSPGCECYFCHVLINAIFSYFRISISCISYPEKSTSIVITSASLALWEGHGQRWCSALISSMICVDGVATLLPFVPNGSNKAQLVHSQWVAIRANSTSETESEVDPTLLVTAFVQTDKDCHLNSVFFCFLHYQVRLYLSSLSLLYTAHHFFFKKNLPK